MKKNQKTEPYSRMNPDRRVLNLLKEYTKIDHGAPAYTLSQKEAEFILETIEDLELEIMRLLTNGIDDD